MGRYTVLFGLFPVPSRKLESIALLVWRDLPWAAANAISIASSLPECPGTWVIGAAFDGVDDVWKRLLYSFGITPMVFAKTLRMAFTSAKPQVVAILKSGCAVSCSSRLAASVNSIQYRRRR